jgi:trk system potassium uptake protein
MVRIASVLHALSIVIVLFAVTMIIPLIVAVVMEDGAALAYDEGILITFGAGAALWFATRKQERKELQPRDGFLLVSLVWTTLPAFATLPLVFYIADLSFTDAYFEAVSGLTTTGATVLSELDKLPASINLWRALLVWIGGMGIIVLAVAILPLLGVGGSQAFKAETPGPMKDTKLTPRITQTAKGLWLVYGLVTLACVVSFQLAGMTWLDAVIHAFSTMGLGGFSSHDDSFGFFNSPAIEAVAIVFMLIAGISFATHFVVLRGRTIRPYRQDPEVMMYLAVVILFWALRHSCTAMLSTTNRLPRCGMPHSTSCRSPRPPDSRTPTTTCGRSSRLCGCCFSAVLRPAPVPPAVVSRWCGRCSCTDRRCAKCGASFTRAPICRSS